MVSNHSKQVLKDLYKVYGDQRKHFNYLDQSEIVAFTRNYIAEHYNDSRLPALYINYRILTFTQSHPYVLGYDDPFNSDIKDDNLNFENDSKHPYNFHIDLYGMGKHGIGPRYIIPADKMERRYQKRIDRNNHKIMKIYHNNSRLRLNLNKVIHTHNNDDINRLLDSTYFGKVAYATKCQMRHPNLKARKEIRDVLRHKNTIYWDLEYIHKYTDKGINYVFYNYDYDDKDIKFAEFDEFDAGYYQFLINGELHGKPYLETMKDVDKLDKSINDHLKNLRLKYRNYARLLYFV